MFTGHSLQDKTYIALKDALFKRYKYTEEGFHERFRKTCPKEGEDFSNYVNKLVLGRDRWFESAGVKKDDYKGLADLVLKEQMYESCSDELVTFLKERNPKTTSDIVGLAEQFQTTHPNAKLSKKPSLCALSLNFKKDKVELWIESRTELDMPVPQIILEENNIATSDNHLGLDLMCHSQILTIDLEHQTSMAMCGLSSNLISISQNSRIHEH